MNNQLKENNIYIEPELNNRNRQIWTDKWDFILTAAGLTLGLNNIWRFPYFCYKNDGGSFFFAYLVTMLFCGLPLLCIEYAIGQLSHKGQVVFANFCPLLKGFVISSLMACIFIIPIYATINCWSFYYLIKSLFHMPIWSKCKNIWNTRHCIVRGTFPNETQLLIESYKEYILSKNLSLNVLLNNQNFQNITGLSSILVDKAQDSSNFNLNNNTVINNIEINKMDINLHKNKILKILSSGNYSELKNLIIKENWTNVIFNYPKLNNLTYLINFASNLTVDNKHNTTSKFIYNTSYYATQEFFDYKINNFNLNSWNSLGYIKIEFVLPLIVIWFSIFFCLRKHLTFSRHSTNCLAIIPIFFILILVLRATMLPGSEIGIIYLFKPTWKGIKKPKVWLYAVGLCFHSIGTVLGTSISMAKCNKSSNHFLKDALLVCFLNIIAVTTFGIIIFSTLGYLSQERNLPIAEVILHGPSVAFVTLSEFLMTLPFPTLWGASFFLLIVFVGFDYQRAFAATLLIIIEDTWGLVIREKFFSHQLFIFLTCMLLFVFNSLFLTQKSTLLILSIDVYITIWLTVILALIEIIIIAWFYGANNFANIIKQKVSKNLCFFFPFCWNFLTPLLLIIILFSNIITFETIKFRNVYNSLILEVAIFLSIFILIFIPIYAIKTILEVKTTNSYLNKIFIACKPNFKIFLDNEIFYNENYNSNIDCQLYKNYTYNSSLFISKTSLLDFENLKNLKRNELLENKLINQSKLTYSVLQNLNETII